MTWFACVTLIVNITLDERESERREASSRDRRDGRDSRDTRDSRDPRDPRESRDGRSSREDSRRRSPSTAEVKKPEIKKMPFIGETCLFYL